MAPPPRFILIASVLLIIIYFYRSTPPVPRAVYEDLQFDEASFGQRGLLAQKLYNLIHEAESLWWTTVTGISKNENDAEKLATRLFPFIQHPSQPFNTAPLRSLRSTFIPMSKGIVIPAGKNSLVYASHLILTLRDILNVTLPIAIAYAGDEDLLPAQRRSLMELRPDVELLDVTATLSDRFMDLRHGSWAIKPFAVLASRFEQVILVDADVVFVQPPELLFDHPGYQESGALFFHDRYFEMNPGNKRQEFIKAETKNLALLDTCCQSILRDGYDDEQDSGVVVIDKRKLQVLIGLLHTCWQNSSPVRNDITYKIFYGDKETFWLGMALSKVPHVFERHSAGIAGMLRERDGKKQVCGNTISHSSDENGSLIWYNGSLLRNKSKNGKTYLVPEYQIVGGQCSWVTDPALQFCCHGGDISELTSSERTVLERSVDIAQKLDGQQEMQSKS
ncbi:Glycosyltransferase family 71 protein [Venustampulla echinocandica]|uniref:Glycosyltransferase family 71 protein n=1 Tax=Venustampulla echinocandica TaxID=2656787 RepID=A0A370TNQ2_9HELO|nr:Glycosyltransferase family 71 protein [Venustampulla echinocandica]RDL37155.1 Glycosyltransferase family 71 protein [Venustampulla echinocandica]